MELCRYIRTAIAIYSALGYRVRDQEEHIVVSRLWTSGDYTNCRPKRKMSMVAAAKARGKAMAEAVVDG